ncbi:MAG: YtxH domain-containing protein [Chloroflexi bacterium]|nr:YtxH domain-containing protein [Chloroflexota bacterium]
MLRGLILGFLMGLGLALFSAPRSGEDLRSMIVERLDEMTGGALNKDVIEKRVADIRAMQAQERPTP